MKKILIVLMLSGLMLTGCAAEEPEIVIVPQGDEIAQEAELPPETPKPEESAQLTVEAEKEVSSELFLEIDPENEYMNYGYTHFMSEDDAVYRLKAENSDELSWMVFVMDEEFPDAERYIPQVYEEVMAADGNIEAEVEAGEGQWVYIYCSANGWTCQEIPEGAHMSVYKK